MGGWRFGLPAACVAGLIGALAWSGPAQAAGAVTVPGTSFPDPTQASLSFVGCQDLYQRGSEPFVPMVGRGPGVAPLGERSLGFDLAGGDAAGAMFPVASVLGTSTVGLAVHADGQAAGVAYVVYQAPRDVGTDLVWIGRTDLSTPGGAWQQVDVVQRDFQWAEYDMTSHAVVRGGPTRAQSVADFVGARGDGPGVFTVGFGCDGTAFNIDEMRIGDQGQTTTYDLEGLTTSVAMASAGSCATTCTLTATLATNTGDPVPDATLILEQSHSANGPWQTAKVVAVNGSSARVTVDPDRLTYYRWRFVDRPLASGSVSTAIQVGGDPTPTPSGSPSSGPDTSPSTSPTGEPSTGPTATPSAPSGTPTSPSSAPPTESTGPSPSNGPTDDPTASGSGSPSESASASPSASSQSSDPSSPMSPGG